jgi:hypothetical protein
MAAFGERKSQYRHRLLGAVITFAIFACVGYVCAFAYSRYKREEARQLIIDMKQIKTGITSEDELRTLSLKYAGIFYTASGHEEPRRTDGRFEVRISGPFLVVRNHFFYVPGQLPWTVLAILDINNGYLDRTQLTVAVLRPNGVILEGDTSINLKYSFGAVEPPYSVSEAHVTGPPTETVVVHLTPLATADEVGRGFNFNFRCLAGVRECQHVCELMPSAWKDLPLENRLHYSDGHEKAIDSECRSALARLR